MMSAQAPKVSVCVNTFRRPELLGKALQSIIAQKVAFSFEIVVVDNDAGQSGFEGVNRLLERAAERGISLLYEVEPVQSIALARNRAIRRARGEIVALIDDDERAEETWLDELIRTLERQSVDGVFGPVLPEYPPTFPQWLVQADLLPRPRYPDGARIPGGSGRSGNAALRRAVLELREGPFDPQYGLTGGEDTELLSYLDRHGASFAWADGAIVHEWQSENRSSSRWYLRRAFRAGWLRMRRAVIEKGITKGALPVLVLIAPSFVRLVAGSLRTYQNPRAMMLGIWMAFANQVGKLAYLAGMKLEEYRVEESSEARLQE